MAFGMLSLYVNICTFTLIIYNFRIVDFISKLGLNKASVIRHMSSVLQPILEKGIVDHSVIHKTLMEYFSIADQVNQFLFECTLMSLEGSFFHLNQVW